jgi:hypothetical protein
VTYLSEVIADAVEQAVNRERERCARIADSHARASSDDYCEAACDIADAIRGIKQGDES